MSKLLPLNALRAFEASARLGSFTNAADELGVTPAAVGQQIRALETRLGVSLFKRSPEGLIPLTDAANALPDIRSGFDYLAQGFETLNPDNSRAHISISVAPTFAIKWLVPRLHLFYGLHPEIEVRFDTTMRFADVGRGEVDLAVRFGTGQYPGLRKERLLEEWVLPLCAPELCQKQKGRKYAKNFPQYTLLHLQGETADPSWVTWPEWAEMHGLERGRFSEGPKFTQSAIALQAAIEGQGVALCGVTFAFEDILAGKLCAPLGTECAIKTHYAYDMVYTSVRAESRSVLAFRRWMKQEALKSTQDISEYLSPPAEENS
jgi:LysR family glycine cleavage system transcriptional activator